MGRFALATNFTSPYILRSVLGIADVRTRTGMSLEPGKPEWKRSSASEAGEVMGVGLQFAASIVLFLFVGRWLDERLGTSPWLLVAGVFVGASAGFFAMYRQLVVRPREKERREKRGR
jgi:ATP synthase protein I